jgi:hypothetical protein
MTIKSLKQDLDAAYEGGFYDDESKPGLPAGTPVKTVKIGRNTTITVPSNTTLESVIEMARSGFMFDPGYIVSHWDDQ